MAPMSETFKSDAQSSVTFRETATRFRIAIMPREGILVPKSIFESAPKILPGTCRSEATPFNDQKWRNSLVQKPEAPPLRFWDQATISGTSLACGGCDLKTALLIWYPSVTPEAILLEIFFSNCPQFSPACRHAM